MVAPVVLLCAARPHRIVTTPSPSDDGVLCVYGVAKALAVCEADKKVLRIKEELQQLRLEIAHMSTTTSTSSASSRALRRHWLPPCRRGWGHQRNCCSAGR